MSRSKVDETRSERLNSELKYMHFDLICIVIWCAQKQHDQQMQK